MHAGPAAEEVVLKKPAGKGGIISKKPASNIQKPVETVESSDDEEDDQKRDRLKARKFDKLLKMDRLPDYIKDEWKHVPHEALCTTCIIVRLAHAVMHTGCQSARISCVQLHFIMFCSVACSIKCAIVLHLHTFIAHSSLTHCMSHVFASATLCVVTNLHIA